MIEVLNNGIRKQKTSKACEVKQLHELMRCYTLDFTCANNNPIVPYIDEEKGCQFIADGQLFDLARYNANAGSANDVSVSTVHVGYRLNNYKLVTLNYAFVGTRKVIAQDILNSCVDSKGNKASSEFKIGTCDDTETISFSLGNEQEVTAKYAIMALKDVGAESDFDNFTINFKSQMGTHTKDNPLEFKLGVNLAKVSKSWDGSSGKTYQLDIADKDVNIHVGDYVKFSTDWEGHTETKRIITYTRYLDNPSKNSITVGNFISDVNSVITSMSVDMGKMSGGMDKMSSDINNSLKMGESYNNVSISHKYGFQSRSNVNGNDIVSQFNSTTGPGIWVNGYKTWGVVPSTGRQFTQSISNLLDSSWFAEMGVTGDGTQQQGLTLSSATTPKYIQITENSGSILFLDKNFVVRLVLGTTGTYAYDASGNQVFAGDVYGTRMLYNENGIGADGKGPYKIINGMIIYDT